MNRNACVVFLSLIMLLRRRAHEQQPNKPAQLPWRPEEQLHKHILDSVFFFFFYAQNVGRPPIFFLCHALKRPDHIRACRRTLRHMGGFLGIPALLPMQTTPPSTRIDKARALRGRWNFPFHVARLY